MKKRIVIIGMRGCGKSHFGNILAKMLNWRHIDLDKEIEKKEKKVISKIVEEKGWDYFREKEHEVCKSVLTYERTIISPGGGAISFERNQKYLTQDALVIFLFASLEDLVKRIKNSKKRPALTSAESITDEIKEIWKQRKDIYFNNADIIFRAKELGRHPKESVEKNAIILLKKIKPLLKNF